MTSTGSTLPAGVADDLDTLRWVRALVASGQARAVRVAAGLTAAEVARAAEVNWRTLVRWEAAEHVPSGPAALRYGRVLEHLLRGTL